MSEGISCAAAPDILLRCAGNADQIWIVNMEQDMDFFFTTEPAEESVRRASGELSIFSTGLEGRQILE